MPRAGTMPSTRMVANNVQAISPSWTWQGSVAFDMIKRHAQRAKRTESKRQRGRRSDAQASFQFRNGPHTQ
jgi:hypothetical protein